MVSEAEAWLKTAIEHLEFADWVYRSENPHRNVATAFYSSLAMEAASSALILHYGLIPSKTHRNYLIIVKLPLPDQKKHQAVALLRRCESILKELTRYPRISPTGEEYLTPRKVISEKDATELLEGAHLLVRFALETVVKS
ncbi:HEPN domain-containing protein [Candidatus Bathyarchaeota archaeon]|nr:HEPN domain-containing protein [Candidatus Bathyarchaeota archaeon]